MDFRFCLCKHDTIWFALPFFLKVTVKILKINKTLLMLFNDAIWAVFVFILVNMFGGHCISEIIELWILSCVSCRYVRVTSCCVLSTLYIKLQIICTSFLLLQNINMLSCILANHKDAEDLKDLKTLKGSYCSTNCSFHSFCNFVISARCWRERSQILVWS